MKFIIDEIIEKSNESDNKLNEDQVKWIISCNTSQYDIVGAFKELKKVEWKQSTNINMNDIVFIYISKPIQSIKYKCIATKVNLSSDGRIDDSKFVIDDTNYKSNGRYMELELLETYNDKQYPIELLKEYGIKSVQGPRKISKELSNYIDDISDNSLINE